ncbi:hypothetical protein NXS19_014430 [Fusarium pseudograminearum]|nr:hypothetical protein NXS19_014430 [Fusarium pseudograminearum]
MTGCRAVGDPSLGRVRVVLLVKFKSFRSFLLDPSAGLYFGLVKGVTAEQKPGQSLGSRNLTNDRLAFQKKLHGNANANYQVMQGASLIPLRYQTFPEIMTTIALPIALQLHIVPRPCMTCHASLAIGPSGHFLRLQTINS